MRYCRSRQIFDITHSCLTHSIRGVRSPNSHGPRVPTAEQWYGLCRPEHYKCESFAPRWIDGACKAFPPGTWSPKRPGAQFGELWWNRAIAIHLPISGIWMIFWGASYLRIKTRGLRMWWEWFRSRIWGIRIGSKSLWSGEIFGCGRPDDGGRKAVIVILQ